MIPGWAGEYRRFQKIIPLTTMDILLGNRYPGRNLFIKIDVEGVEHALLMGAKSVLARSPRPVWMVEICVKEFFPGGMNPNFEEIFRIFMDNGYEARTAELEPRLVTAEDVSRYIRNGRSDSGVLNYLFTPTRG
jgi:hypothetical protein